MSADEQIRSPDIGQRLKILLKNQLFTDVKFIINCGIHPKPCLLAHKAILAVGSHKFKEMLFNSNIPASDIQINNVSFEAFKNVVEYLYTDDVIFKNNQIMLETLSAAHKFQIQTLVNKCESYIELFELTQENVCSLVEQAIDYNSELLKTRCIKFIQENTGPVLRSSDFLTSKSSTILLICQMEQFALRSEIELLSGIIRWVDATYDSNENKRIYVEPFLQNLRLLNVSCEEFNHFIQKNADLFTAAEVANILCALSNPFQKSIALPYWCKKGSNRCLYNRQDRQNKARVSDEFMYNTPLKRLCMPLRSTNSSDCLSNLVCCMEIKCFSGKHQVNAIKLAFDNPVDKSSVIGQLIITVDVRPSMYHLEKFLEDSVENTREFEINFSRRILVGRGDTLIIRAEAQSIREYKFYQFKDKYLISKYSIFKCTLSSVPGDKNWFFIDEVIYQTLAPHRPSY